MVELVVLVRLVVVAGPLDDDARLVPVEVELHAVQPRLVVAVVEGHRVALVHQVVVVLPRDEAPDAVQELLPRVFGRVVHLRRESALLVGHLQVVQVGGQQLDRVRNGRKGDCEEREVLVFGVLGVGDVREVGDELVVDSAVLVRPLHLDVHKRQSFFD